ncbi:hypothetical protein [Mangrovimonas sp. YM274]|uniref:hypothetical protein n=1 Tax=Mangrovimonas sp. YM274 TaxID=3070660 RepID=UPI0027DAE3C4|nr:hypothetical protein [Mangrovimonas sp. YM274]WMI68689.1 hypothetical protein RBH95_16270 [Mangrovimonas sp. YM274]
MKTLCTKRSFFILFLFLTFGFMAQVYAQDKVIMLSGEEKTGKILGLDDSTVKFVHSGEDLEYTLKKSEIEKIIFSSGRVEVINQKVAAADPLKTAADKRNKIAVMPFNVNTNDPAVDPNSMGKQMQNDCVFILRAEKAGMYTIQDPMTTEALLSQNGISPDQVRTTPPGDMAKMLGVEYVLYGTCDLQNKGARSYGSSVNSYNEKQKRDDRDKKTKGTEVTSTNSSTTIMYDTHITLSVFNDQGKNVYSETRNPFGSGTDAYSAGMKYLLKRSPFGTKH